jgi:hypothetical protein
MPSEVLVEKVLNSLRNHSFDSVKRFGEVLNELLLKEGVCEGQVFTFVLPKIMFSEDGRVAIPVVIKCVDSDYAYGVVIEIDFTLRNVQVVWRERVDKLFNVR